MSKQIKINEVYIKSSNFGCMYIQQSGDCVGSYYTKDWFSEQLILNKIMNKVQKKYPNTPILLHDSGCLMFVKDNDEFADEINHMFETLVMKHRRITGQEIGMVSN